MALLAVLALSACFGGGGGGSAPTATLRIHAGSVEVSVDDATFSAGSEGQILSEGSTVRTAADGRAAIEWFDGSVTRLDHDTTFKIVTMAILDNDEQSKVIEAEQTEGNTYSRVTELTDAASRFDIETPTATASVQGTVYAVILNPDGSTTVAVIEGSVGVGDTDVPEGFMIVIDSSGAAGDPEPIPDDLLNGDWIVYNCELDGGDLCPDEGSTTTTTVLGPEEPTTTTTGAPTTTTTEAPTTTTTAGGGVTTTAAPTTTTTISSPEEPPTTTTTAATTTTTAAPTTTTTAATTTTTAAPTTTTSAATTTTTAGGRSLELEGLESELENCTSRTFTAWILVGNQTVDEDGTVVTFAQVSGGGEVSFPNGSQASTVNGVATIELVGAKPGGVELQAFTGDGLVSNTRSFDVQGTGNCDATGVILPPTFGRGGFDRAIDPLAALAAFLIALLGVAAVSARRSMQRLA
jgi:hypothetical protein